MKKIKYTPDAADKIRALNQYITHHYGSDKAQKIIRIITDAVRGLSQNERKGVKASNMFDIVTDYRYIFIAKNYIFYRIEEEYICIINIDLYFNVMLFLLLFCSRTNCRSTAFHD